MKQKMVINVTMNCEKCRSKALKIAVGLPGVESASLKGDGKSQIEVTGGGVDPVQLTCLLRTRMGHAELVSVNAAGGGGTTTPTAAPKGGENKGGKNKDKDVKPAVQPYVWPYIPQYYVYEVPYYLEASYCSIL